MNRLCKNCGESFLPCRSVPGQEYCSDPVCQSARKRLWQKRKLAGDPDYRENKKSSQRAWRDKNPSYMRDYRARSQKYVNENRLQQHSRNKRRKKLCENKSVLPSSSSSLIVKTDELKACLDGLFMPYSHLGCLPGFIVKMDEFLAYQQPFSSMSFLSVFFGVDCKDMTSSPGDPGLIKLLV